MRSHGASEPNPTGTSISTGTATPTSIEEFPWIAVAAALLVGFALRLPALFQDPWIDEVWSWGLARSRDGLLDVFTIRTSNSHTLNTLWIRLVGDQRTFFLYRLPSLVAGLACIPLAARIAGRSGRRAAVAAAWVVALSFLGVVFSSEARGYALMLACTLVAYESAWTWVDTARRRWLVLGWVAALVGVLAQTLFVLGWGAIAIAVLVRILREGRGRSAHRIFAFFVPSAAFFATWWFVNVRHVVNGGAPPWDLSRVVTRTLAWRTGLPVTDWALGVGLVLFAVVLIADVRARAARRDPSWIAQVGLVAIVPCATTAILWDEFLAPRYFLVPLVFWAISLARVLANLFEHAGPRRILAIALFVLYASGNLFHAVAFLRVGRGHVGALVREMAAQQSTAPRVVTGNYDFNVGAQIEWHQHAWPEPHPLVYVSQAKLPVSGADFVVVDRPRFDTEPAVELRVAGRAYRRIATSVHVGPCGSDWAVYMKSAQ